VKSTLIKLLIAAAGLVLVLWLLDESSDSVERSDNHGFIKQVSVISVKPGKKQPNVSVTGIVKPRWQVQVIANVSGKLVEHYEDILPGQFVEKGQALAQIDEVDHAAALTHAESQVAEAELNLARYLNEQAVAKRLENGKKHNDYRLYKPHVAAAKVELKAAKANYQSALKRFNETSIKAPFDAIVLDKYIVPAQQINVGEQVYSLASANAVDIEVNLSQAQWQQVIDVTEVSAQVIASNGVKWPAKIRYLSPTLNQQTRQRHLLMSVLNPYQTTQPLFPEQQVTVSFTARSYDLAVVVPASVLTRDNKVWALIDGKLSLEQVVLLEERADTVMLSFVDEPNKSRQLILYPLSNMLEGQSVEAKLVQSSVLAQEGVSQ